MRLAYSATDARAFGAKRSSLVSIARDERTPSGLRGQARSGVVVGNCG